MLSTVKHHSSLIRILQKEIGPFDMMIFNCVAEKNRIQIMHKIATSIVPNKTFDALTRPLTWRLGFFTVETDC